MDPYPHSLYLYLLRTVGIVGLFAVVGFFVQTSLVLRRALQREASDSYRSAIVRLGLVVIAAFLVEQVRLEFNRQETIDYAQFVFALMGLLVGVSDRSAVVSRARSAGPPVAARL
jgi:O-antigen ligase